jgi:hypothetical protein
MEGTEAEQVDRSGVLKDQPTITDVDDELRTWMVELKATQDMVNQNWDIKSKYKNKVPPRARATLGRYQNAVMQRYQQYLRGGAPEAPDPSPIPQLEELSAPEPPEEPLETEESAVSEFADDAWETLINFANYVVDGVGNESTVKTLKHLIRAARGNPLAEDTLNQLLKGVQTYLQDQGDDALLEFSEEYDKILDSVETSSSDEEAEEQ